jgi:hypothetical protein
MKPILALTLGAFVLCANGVSTQTPTSAQAGAKQTNQTNQAKQTHYTGCVGGNANSGYTLSTAGKTATAAPIVYSLVAADGTKIDLVAMPGQKVEVTGALVPVKAGDKGKPRVVEVTEVKVVPGGC